MIIKEIEYSRKFVKQFKQLPVLIQEKTVKTETVFKRNPFYPGLRLHKLQGQLQDYWSVSITRDYRIIMKMTDEGKVIFGSIGRHSIYEK